MKPSNLPVEKMKKAYAKDRSGRVAGNINQRGVTHREPRLGNLDEQAEPHTEKQGDQISHCSLLSRCLDKKRGEEKSRRDEAEDVDGIVLYKGHIGPQIFLG